MAVQSYLNLYTWLLGWQLYDQIWAMLANLGLLAVPFAFIAIKSVYEPLSSGHSMKRVGDAAIVRMITQILLAMVVLVSAGVPSIELQPSQVNYTPSCVTSPTAKTANNTGTTYDNLITIPESIKVPIYWYLIMSFSNGFTDQAKSFVSCPVVDLRSLQAELITTSIKSPQLKSEVKRFRSECYIPAYSRYLNIQDKDKQNTIEQSISQYGEDDLSWIGSETFQTVPGFYDSLYAESPVMDFPNTGSAEDNIQSQVGSAAWGTPSCKQWWQNDGIGLRSKLYNNFTSHTQETLAEAAGGYDKKIAQDAAIYSMLVKNTGGNFWDKGFSSEEDKTPDNMAGKVLSEVGADWTGSQQFSKIHMLQNMLPIFQALVEFLYFVLLPIMLVFSGFSLRFVISASFFLFALIFMSFLWSTVTYIDNFLMQAMYHAFKPDGSFNVFGYVSNIMLEKANPNANILDFVISTFYVGSTLFFLVMAGWIGWKGGTAIAGNSKSMEGIGDSAGGKGAASISAIARVIK